MSGGGSSSSNDKSDDVKDQEETMAEEEEGGVLGVLTLLQEYANQHCAAQESQSLALWNLTKARRAVQGRSSAALVQQHEITAHAIRLHLDATTKTTVITTTTTTMNTSVTSKDDDDNGNEEGDEDDPELLPESVGSASTRTEKNEKGGQPCLSSSRIAFTLVDSNRRSMRSDNNKNEEQGTVVSTLPQAASVDSEIVLETAATTGLRQRKRTGTVTAKETNQAVVKQKGPETITRWSVEDFSASAANSSDVPTMATATANSTTTKSVVDPLLLFCPLPPAELRLARDQAVKALTAYCHAATLAAAILTALAAATTTHQQPPCGDQRKQPHE